MILTCPDCATRYFVDDRKLGPTGRTVRCAGCGTTWRARAEDEAPLELGAATQESVAARIDGEPLSFKPVAPQDLPAPELPRAFRAKQEQKRRVRRMAAAGAVWAGLALGFAALLFCAWVFRVDVVRVFPRAAAAYALARVNATGLQFDGVNAQPAADDAGAVLVQGRLRNVVSQRAAVPLIRITLLDKKGIRMKQRVIQLDQDWIAPGATLPFQARFSDPRAAAADADVSFALDMAPPPRPLRRTAVAVAAVGAPAPEARAVPPSAPASPPALRPMLGEQPPPATSAHAPVSLPGLDSTPGERVSPPPHG
jgi:predicted Zn finger-like uncharacterized protein